ncbi:MAG TPA: S1 RNA-binding domain-containing protein [Polyangiaceae bacterium]|jgi:small subunit ribosomal protein S1|nr:S1 RNA-binding domain-containing protein [Polyangiaceae bacterium]
MSDESFASLMKQAVSRGSATGRRLHPGEVVRVKVIQVAGDSVFVDAGTPGDGRIPRVELLGEDDEMLVAVGAVIDAAVVDPRPDGPRFTVSRRALVEEQRRAARAEAVARIVPGAELEGTVSAFNRHGAIVDLDGVEGFVHLSELAWRRVERAEDAVQIGERVRARVLSVEESERGPRVKVSLRALQTPEPVAAPVPDEVLKAKVLASVGGGITVTTSKGEGFVRLAELGLPPGADHRRAFPAGKELEVVLLSNAGGRLRFSATQVARVEERKNFRDYGAATATGASFGHLGDLLRERLGLPPAEPEPPAAKEPAKAAAAADTAMTPVAPKAPAAATPIAPKAPAAAAPVAPRAPAAPPPNRPRSAAPDGVIRRRRP